MDLDRLPDLWLKGCKYTAREAVETLNYGKHPLFSQLVTFLDTSQGLYYIWDSALLQDLSLSLSGDTWNSQLAVWSILLSQEDGMDFESRISSAHVHIPLKIIYHCLQFFHRRRAVPHSYIVAAILRFVNYLRQNLASDTPTSEDLSIPSVVQFGVQFEDFWRATAGKRQSTEVKMSLTLSKCKST
jgi:hypothetical protein